MNIQQLSTTSQLTDQQQRLLHTIETVIAERKAWDRIRIRIQMCILNDFRLSAPTETQVCDWIEQFQVFAMVLHDVADQIAQEADDVTDLFHTWLVD